MGRASQRLVRITNQRTKSSPKMNRKTNGTRKVATSRKRRKV